jgi:hypothetical protein
MEGFIKITATENGIGTEVKLAHISGLDKVLLLNSFAQGLHMDDKELQQAVMVLPLARGLMDNDGVGEEVEHE